MILQWVLRGGSAGAAPLQPPWTQRAAGAVRCTGWEQGRVGGVWLLLSSHPLPFCWGCAPEPGFREHLFLASSHLCIFFPHRYYFFNNENNELGASIASLQPPMMMCGMSPGSRFLLPACMGMERGAQGQHLLGWGSHRGGLLLAG